MRKFYYSIAFLLIMTALSFSSCTSRAREKQQVIKTEDAQQVPEAQVTTTIPNYQNWDRDLVDYIYFDEDMEDHDILIVYMDSDTHLINMVSSTTNEGYRTLYQSVYAGNGLMIERHTIQDLAITITTPASDNNTRQLAQSH